LKSNFPKKASEEALNNGRHQTKNDHHEAGTRGCGRYVSDITFFSCSYFLIGVCSADQLEIKLKEKDAEILKIDEDLAVMKKQVEQITGDLAAATSALDTTTQNLETTNERASNVRIWADEDNVLIHIQ